VRESQIIPPFIEPFRVVQAASIKWRAFWILFWKIISSSERWK